MKNLRDVEVLVVEDSAVQLEMLRRTLAEEGYRVSVAENGAKALEMIRVRKPSLVISDIVMPVMDGYTMCQEIKNDGQLRDIPVILLTDLSDPKDVIKGLNAKADNYVTKPYRAKLLLARIESLLTTSGEFEDTDQRGALVLNYGGESYFLSSGPRQILNLLISTYENAVHQHQDLIETQNKLVIVMDELEIKLRKLQESEHRLLTLIQTIPDIVYRMDKEGRFIFVNNAVGRLGFEPEELIGKHFSEIVFHTDVERNKVKHIYDDGTQEFSQEYRVTTSSGEIRWVDDRMWVRHSERGDIKYREGVLIDVTARKQAEENLLREKDQRAFIRRTFDSYLSEDVVSEILESPDGVSLGGGLREITILVSDLREFTRITASLDPRQILAMINRYLEVMTEIIVRHGGTIDEFMGDGILAFFGAPRPFQDHSRRAVACAIDMQNAMYGLNKENLSLGHPELRMGIGINCGELVVGNIGSQTRKKYGAVGSPINVAFRVEAQTAGGEILVTSAVYEHMQGDVSVGEVREVRLKGVDGLVTLYRVTSITA